MSNKYQHSIGELLGRLGSSGERAEDGRVVPRMNLAAYEGRHTDIYKVKSIHKGG